LVIRSLSSLTICNLHLERTELEYVDYVPLVVTVIEVPNSPERAGSCHIDAENVDWLS
jgi:hypothetical protein